MQVMQAMQVPARSLGDASRFAPRARPTPPMRFTLGQEGDHYVFRLRNDVVADGYVERPSKGGATLELSHVVVTARANETMNFWVNGVRTSHALPAGGFGFQQFRLALANEIDGFASERHWEGDYLLVAVYCRVLTEAEISRNREVGPPR